MRAGAAMAAVGFTVAALGSVLVLLAADLDVPTQELAWLASGFGAGLIVVALTGPRLLARGASTVLRLASALLAGGVALLALAGSLATVVLGALSLGVGAAAIVLAASALLSGPGAARRLSAVNAAASTAGVLAPLALGSFEAFAGAGRLALLVLVPPLLILAAVPDRVTTTTKSSPAAAPPALVVGEAVRRWALVVLAVSVEFCFALWGVARLQATGLTPAGAVAAATAFPLGMAIGRTAGVRWAQAPGVLPVSIATTAIATTAVVAGSGPVIVALGLAVAGLGVALMYPLTLAALLACPGLGAERGASAGAAASGTAILLAPLALGGLAALVEVRLAFLVVLVPLTLLAVHSARLRAAQVARA